MGILCGINLNLIIVSKHDKFLMEWYVTPNKMISKFLTQLMVKRSLLKTVKLVH